MVPSLGDPYFTPCLAVNITNGTIPHIDSKMWEWPLIYPPFGKVRNATTDRRYDSTPLPVLMGRKWDIAGFSSTQRLKDKDVNSVVLGPSCNLFLSTIYGETG